MSNPVSGFSTGSSSTNTANKFLQERAPASQKQPADTSSIDNSEASSSRIPNVFQRTIQAPAPNLSTTLAAIPSAPQLPNPERDLLIREHLQSMIKTHISMVNESVMAPSDYAKSDSAFDGTKINYFCSIALAELFIAIFDECATPEARPSENVKGLIESCWGQAKCENLEATVRAKVPLLQRILVELRLSESKKKKLNNQINSINFLVNKQSECLEKAVGEFRSDAYSGVPMDDRTIKFISNLTGRRASFAYDRFCRAAPTSSPTAPVNAPAPQLTPAQRASLIQKTLDNMVKNMQSLDVEATGFPDARAFTVMTIREFCTFVLTQSFFAILGESIRQESKPSDEAVRNSVVKFGKFIQARELSNAKAIFDNFIVGLNGSETKKAALNKLLNNIDCLVKMQNSCLVENVGEFKPDGFHTPQLDDLKKMAQYLVAQQRRMIECIRPVLRTIELKLKSEIKELSDANILLSHVPATVGKNMKRLADNSLDLTTSVSRLMTQFSIYAEIRDEKIKDLVYHTQENLGNDSLVSSFTHLKDLLGKLVITKNPYAEKYVDYLECNIDLQQLGIADDYQNERLQSKLIKIFDKNLESRSNFFKCIVPFIKAKPELKLSEILETCVEIWTEIARKYGVKIDTGEKKKHLQEYENIKLLAENFLDEHVDNSYTIWGKGLAGLKVIIGTERDLKRNSANQFISVCNEIRSKPPYAGMMDLNGEELEEFLRSYFDEIRKIAQDNPTILKENLLLNLRNNLQKEGAWKAVYLKQSINQLQSILDDAVDFQICDDLLLYLSPYINKYHQQLLSLAPQKTICNDYEWFYTAELPRDLQKRKGSESTTQRKAKSVGRSTLAHAKVEESQPPVLPQKQPEVKLPAMVATREMFAKGETLLLGTPHRDLTKVESHLLYHADAAYHLFHVMSLVEMSENACSNHVRHFIPEMVNALALLQEQVVTPIYVQKKNPLVVTHDLKLMNTSLGITTPSIYNWGSQCYRYPNAVSQSKLRAEQQLPSWLQEIVELEDYVEFEPKKSLKNALGRMEHGLKYVTDLLDSHELRDAYARVIEKTKKISPATAEAKIQPDPKVATLLAALENKEKDVLRKNDPKLLIIWKDLKVHANRFKRAEEILRTYPQQSYLSIAAQSTIMSAQYFVEHCGLLNSHLVEGDCIHTHRLSNYAGLYGWDNILTATHMETLSNLDIEKGSDYPSWTLWSKNTPGHEPEGLKLLSSAYEVATVAMESDEGFQSTTKHSHAPDQVRAELDAFLQKSIDLMTTLVTNIAIQ